MSSDVLLEAVGVAVLFGAVAASWVAVIGRGVRHERAMLKTHSRAHRAHYAAVEAAEDDPSFAPEAIEQFVDSIVAIADRYWHTGGFDDLERRPDADLVRAWARSRQFWLGDGLSVRGRPGVDVLQVVNRDDEGEDRVVLRVRVFVRCRRPRFELVALHRYRFVERWTLGHRAKRWVLLSVSGDPLAGPVLTGPLVPNRSYDDDRLREESLAELAQKVDGDIDLSELVSPDDPPALALLDLSVVDGRFLPALVAARIAHLLDAWEGAATGSWEPLEALATSRARDALLRPAPGKRLVVRDVVLESWEPTRLLLARRPPAIEVRLEVEAVRYVVAANGTRLAGNQRQRRRMALAWTLELTDGAPVPWRLATSNVPAEAVPGWS